MQYMALLNRQFQEYALWREQVSSALDRYLDWLNAHNLGSDDVALCLSRARQRLKNQKLSVAFVAEFSRGKSELINAMFFANYGQRILPSAAGRTTMCPTELLYNPDEAPCIKLLPIETRSEQGSTVDFKHLPQVWNVIPLNLDSPQQLHEALSRVAESKRVPLAMARQYGLFNDEDLDQFAQVRDGMIDISAWRHAIINFPHPILMQGLVIIDTPGLNAIGTEPELTLNLIPNADAVLFILAADTGVTKSDIEVWRKHIGGPAEYSRLVVLNKIDAMWDELKSSGEIEAEVRAQVRKCAAILSLEERQVFAVSAQKGLVGKIQQDSDLLQKSRLMTLEHALSRHLVPQRKRILAEQITRDLDRVAKSMRHLIKGRAQGCRDQLFELHALRGKNAGSVVRMLGRIEQEEREFDQTIATLQATRHVFAKLSKEIHENLAGNRINQHIAEAQARITKGHLLALGLKSEFNTFFEQLHQELIETEKKMDEILRLIQVMTRRFATEYAMSLPAPMSMTLLRYHEELDQLENRISENVSPIAFISLEKTILVSKFFDTIAALVKTIFTKANNDLNGWLQSLLGPIESQTCEHQRRLQRRHASIKKIYAASDELEQRIEDLQSAQNEVDALAAEHDAVAEHLRESISEFFENMDSPVPLRQFRAA
jgi:hypothetical protein